jgi:hypothetical protein
LNEFFSAPKQNTQDGDLLAHDFIGFTGVGAFLNDGDYKQLHKRVGHMTHEAVRNSNVTWEIHEGVKVAITKSCEFLDFLVDDFLTTNSERRDYADTARKAFQRCLAEMEEAKAQETPNH